MLPRMIQSQRSGVKEAAHIETGNSVYLDEKRANIVGGWESLAAACRPLV